MIIELRWLSHYYFRPKGFGDLPVIVDGNDSRCVLQFRVGYHSSETGLDTWEPWQDVPIAFSE